MIAFYRNAFERHGRNERALDWSRNKQAVRFSALCRQIPEALTTVLDYGCGLGDLALWLRRHRPRAAYVGVDVVQEFIESNKITLPDYQFLTIKTPRDLLHSFDHIVCSGVFNINPAGDESLHWTHVQGTIDVLMARTRRALHLDFLAPDVDYRQSWAYHQDIQNLTRFIEDRISRRYCVDRSYMPYEFCVSIFANRTIDESRNVYADAHELV